MSPVGIWSGPPRVGRGRRAGIMGFCGRAATGCAVGVVGGCAAVVGGVGLCRGDGAHSGQVLGVQVVPALDDVEKQPHPILALVSPR
jgi:hypothetical protein